MKNTSKIVSLESNQPHHSQRVGLKVGLKLHFF